MKKTIIRTARSISICSFFLLLITACSADHNETAPVFKAILTPATENIKIDLDGEHRSVTNKARDKYRHPAQTLNWFGIKADMTVVEIFPGGGWYTEILAPLLKEKGTLYAAGGDPQKGHRGVENFDLKMQSHAIYSKVKITVLAPPGKTAVAPAGSADAVLTFRNIHNWMKAGTADAVFSAMFTALKPGGLLGVVEHRNIVNAMQDTSASSGYVNPAYAIQLAEKAGFVYVDSAEINANPKDTKFYPRGVWTLPPTLALMAQDREKYKAIGESDRFTLKFIKPE